MFKKFKALLENQTGRKIKKLRTDNGLEFCETNFNEFCVEQGIARHKTLVGTPQQNGVAKRMNRTLLEKASCMLSRAGLWHRRDFWAKAVLMACYHVNRSPHSSIDFKIPEEVWSGNPIDYSVLKVFGCPAYVHVNDGKLAPRALECMFLGYGSESKGYRLWCPTSKKLIQSRNVKFNESAMFSPGNEPDIDAGNQDKVEFEVFPQGGGSPSLPPSCSETKDHIPSPVETPVEDLLSIARDRPRRTVRRPARYATDDESGMIAYALVVAQEISEGIKPSTYLEAISCPNSSNWLMAMQKEMQSLHKNGTWELCELPKGRRALTAK